MPEDTNNESAENSASDVFDALIGEIKKQREKKLLGTIGESANDIDAGDLQSLNDSLNNPIVSGHFNEAMEKKGREIFGLVIGVNEVAGDKRVTYINQDGMQMGFVFDSQSPAFNEAKEGFNVGDVILNKFKEGNVMDQVKPLNLSTKQKLEFIQKVQKAYSILNPD